MTIKAECYNLFCRGVLIGNMQNDKPSRTDESHHRNASHHKSHPKEQQRREKLQLGLSLKFSYARNIS